MFCHTGLRQKALGDRREWLNDFSHGLRKKALGDRREWLNVLSHLTAREGTWRSSGVAECLVGDFHFEAENVTDRMLAFSPL